MNITYWGKKDNKINLNSLNNHNKTYTNNRN
jgi:hypothetical protein